MNRKQLAWNKDNIEKAQAAAERKMTSGDTTLYGILRALLWAVGFILDQIAKEEK